LEVKAQRSGNQAHVVAGILLAWVTAIVFLHALLLFEIGATFKQDWGIISVASNANIGGATSAGVLATAIGRADLRLRGILAGSLATPSATTPVLSSPSFLR
jgi:uncharacterized membrane protein